MSDRYTTKEVVERLDLLIAIMKLSNKKELDDIKIQINKDDVFKKIIDLCSDSPMVYSDLVSKVMESTGKKERTVQGKISELQDMKILNKNREGRNVVYSYSGILE